MQRKRRCSAKHSTASDVNMDKNVFVLLWTVEDRTALHDRLHCCTGPIGAVFSRPCRFEFTVYNT